ncbi:DUF1415 family protein, partial [Mycobacterium tuberculosis]|nr:DUF1415 family protein [Mycobacterium tuberculosis]
VEALVEELAEELVLLRDTPAEQIDTTLIVHPDVLTDFLDYNDFLDNADAAIEADLRRTHCVDDDARRVRRIPHLELVLERDGGIAEVAALEADERPLAVVEPFDVVARSD